MASLGPVHSRGTHILVVDDDIMIRELVRVCLEASGYGVTAVDSGATALAILEAEHVDLVISDIMMPEMDGFALVSKLRASSLTRAVPVVFLTSRVDPTDAATGLRLSANDFIRKPFTIQQLSEKVAAVMSGRATTAARMVQNPRELALPFAEFVAEVERRGAGMKHGTAVGVVDLDEREALHARFGDFADNDLGARLVALLIRQPGDQQPLLGRDHDGRFLVVAELESAEDWLADLAVEIASTHFSVAGEGVTITPTIGWAETSSVSPQTAIQRATIACDVAANHLDLQPVRWTPELESTRSRPVQVAWHRRVFERSRTGLQIVATLILGLGVPFAVYMALHRAGIDLVSWFYAGIVIALVVTGLMIWIEGFNALDPERPPKEPSSPPPPATAIIAAYLPNEAATIVETVERFLRTQYSDLQVILAYNTPRGFLVERTLREISARDPRFVPLRVEGSTSKAQNVNAALRHASGEFVGIFDADHHPEPGSFDRAWRWLSNGYAVVQGHCVIRNGEASLVSRAVAIEFEAIYAVAHPGRARIHQFGVFGGSNGYWRTEVLRSTRMHGFMLTEDIDSSLRVIEAGGRIANDPALISRELAPTTLHQLWNQRMRWAQGWFQVSRKHFGRGLRSKVLTRRQKFGFAFLLGWREVYPWISIQMVPLIAFLAWREGGLQNLSWLIALFVLTTLFAASVGPGQTLFAWRLAVPELRRRKAWFWMYLLWTSFFFTEWKNTISRVAQIKELMRERQWKVTPRAAVPKGLRS